MGIISQDSMHPYMQASAPKARSAYSLTALPRFTVARRCVVTARSPATKSSTAGSTIATLWVR